jgi:hypothetical protein
MPGLLFLACLIAYAGWYSRLEETQPNTLANLSLEAGFQNQRSGLLNAAVFCVDEKSAIQALDRLDPVLPLSLAEPNGTALNIFVMVRSHCMQR